MGACDFLSALGYAVKGLENLMQLKVLARGKFSDGFMATPAVTGNALILRTKSAVYRVEK